MLASFEHCEGGLLGVSDIISEAEKVKENFACPPNSSLFGLLIKQIWGGKVKLVKRGSHKQRRVNYYENLQRKSSCNTSLVDLRSQIQQISPLNNGWHLLLDQGEDLSLIRHESWSFQNQRVITEVKVRSKNGLNSISLHSHGCQTDITDLFKLDYLKNQHSSIELILSIVNSSPLCRGITVTEALHTTLPHETGYYSDLTSSTKNSEQRAFSANCSIISSVGECCSNCKKLHHLVQKCKKRKLESNGVASPFTNKRFLSKDEVEKQLQKERQARLNAEKREKYWREKFEAECLEMDDEDHTDLSAMFDKAGSNVPEHMASLWEQQQQLLRCKSKKAYRWHPK